MSTGGLCSQMSHEGFTIHCTKLMYVMILFKSNLVKSYTGHGGILRRSLVCMVASCPLNCSFSSAVPLVPGVTIATGIALETSIPAAGVDGNEPAELKVGTRVEPVDIEGLGCAATGACMYSMMLCAKISKSVLRAGSLYLRPARASIGLSIDCIWAKMVLYGRVRRGECVCVWGGGGSKGREL